ncbi:EAL domain-containing protein [Sulfobacillus sp. hq2]|uniref:EAL domain-containing protein n=1 Tax=Sulfobacillus TaxID=28033 RepID=UPI001304CC17|nr:EAL domain-containing protein [Sulfobacillus sp. hq2]
MENVVDSLTWGMLEAGLLVGIWEFGDLVFRPRWRYGAPLATAFLTPLALGWLFIQRLVPVPWAVFAMGVVAAWMWLSNGWAWLATLTTIAVWTAIVGGIDHHAVKAFVGAVSLSGLALMAPVVRRHRPRTWWLWVSLYGITILVILAVSGLNGDSEADAWITAVVALFSGVYAFGQVARTQAWAQTQRHAEEDRLTGVFNRYGGELWLGRLEPGTVGMVIACDLDDFKWFNDTWGHTAGDAVLVEAVRRMQRALRAGDAIMRPGGDEFTVWLPHVPEDQADSLAQRLHRAVTEQPINVDGHQVALGCSMGWTVGVLNDSTAMEADKILLAAKRLGKNRAVGPHPDAVSHEPPSGVVSARHLTTIVESLWARWEEAAVLTDRDGRILTCNRAFEVLTGRSAQELRGYRPGINSAGETPEAVYRAMWQRLDMAEPWRGVLLNQRGSGQQWWAYDEIWPVEMGTHVVAYWTRVRSVDPSGLEPLGRELAWNGLQMTAVFQPLIFAQTGAHWGYEALVRPRMAEHAIAPDKLFAMAQATNTVAEVDRMALIAIAQAISQSDALGQDQWLSLNVRAATLQNKHWLNDYLDHLGVPRSHIILEISEHDSLPVGYSSWREIRQAYPEVAFALDDWGTGTHDILRLLDLAPEWIKVDRSWLVAARRNRLAQELLVSLNTWAHRAQGALIVEGVETAEEAGLLKDLKVVAAQGYYWGRPAPFTHR